MGNDLLVSLVGGAAILILSLILAWIAIRRRYTIFISYSHRDAMWKDRLRRCMPKLQGLNRRLIKWDEQKIDEDGHWYAKLRKETRSAKVTVCLISQNYLDSSFCNSHEFEHLIEERKGKGMHIIPVLLRHCDWQSIPWLRDSRTLPPQDKSICEDFGDNEDEVLDKVAGYIHAAIHDSDFELVRDLPADWVPLDEERIDIHRLPMTGAELLGRRKEMRMLNKAWESDSTNVVSLVAYGGMGKSTLVNKWLERMDRDNYRGARRVYAWSFYSQGTGERVTSADQFIAAALEVFGDPEMAKSSSSPWAKGERLAELVRQEKSLLILDGLEPLQSDLENGKVKDPALGVLITELARENPGLCVITTRVKAPELTDFSETTKQENLEQISDAAGRALLRVSGVRGDDAQLESATRDFGNHALALNLLAAYLHEIPGHSISDASQIPDVDISEEEGKHPCRMIAAFEERFGDGPEVELLWMLGLFDRPADKGSIDALRAEPAIPDLTEHIHGLGEGEWLRLLHELRRVRLIAPESEHNPDVLDAHPLVREHFGRQLRTYPDAWREGNNRLYEHLKATAEELPDTIEDMVPLYAAVAHGCKAGRHEEALDEVYFRRIRRGTESFSVHKLGAFSADLAALSGFFDTFWGQPVAGLTEIDKAFVLNQAGFRLHALGRLSEALQPMKAALEARIAQEDWVGASKNAGNLSELNLAIGDMSRSLDYARQGVELANRSGDLGQRMLKLTTLANALYQSDQLQEAEASFREAEEMQKDWSRYSVLYSVQGFQYCDLLLGQGKHQEVQNRAGQTLEWAKQYKFLLDIALDHLSLGRAHLLQAQVEGTGDFAQAADKLDQAVDGLRESGNQDEVPRGLLARAELHRVCGDYEHAQRDLDEAMTIATRGGMGLHEADCHLEYARLHLAMGDRDSARERLDIAKEMIEDMGYGRRNRDVKELERKLTRGQGEGETRG